MSEIVVKMPIRTPSRSTLTLGLLGDSDRDVLRPLTLLIEAPERAAKHPGVLRRGCLAVGYI